MKTPPKSGFETTKDGISFWFYDAAGIVSFLGPISSLERLNASEWKTDIIGGRPYRITLTQEQIDDFRRRGGVVKPEAGQPNVPPIVPHAGFQKAVDGLYYWWRQGDQISHVGPLRALEELEDGAYHLLTASGRHVIRFGPEYVDQFLTLGGVLLRKPQPAELKVPSMSSPAIAAPAGAAEHSVSAPATMIWRGEEKSVKFAGRIIPNPMTYFSRFPLEEAEASCIDATLPVGSPISEPRGALGYWPEYRRMTPHQRANYLDWLASGREAPLDDIGYAFVHFYGLERRVLVDQRDINPITIEIVRLLERYTFSGSFTGYLSRFLTYVVARTGLEKLRQEWFDHIFDNSSMQPNEDILALALAWHVTKSQPLSAKWAMRIASDHPQTSRSVVVQRVPEQFESLFAKKFQTHFGNGLMLRTSQRDRVIDYRQPASPSLLNLRHQKPDFAPPISVPNVLGLQSQFQPFVRIWEECIEELKPLSRRVSKGEAANTSDAYELLPEDLRKEIDHPDKAKWDLVVGRHITGEGQILVSIGELATLRGFDGRPKLTGKQSEAVAKTAECVGYCLEPDYRATQRAYASDDIVALFRPMDGASIRPDPRYMNAALILEMGFAVAAADGIITSEESGHIARFLENQFVLDQGETWRLKQLQAVFMQRHPSLARISKRLVKTLSAEQRDVLGRFTFAIAAANGDINPPTMKALRQAYRSIGLDVARLDTLLSELSSAPTTQVATTVNDFPTKSTAGADVVVRLDPERIRLILDETQRVAELLGDAFKDEEEDRESPSLISRNGLQGKSDVTVSGSYSTLPTRYHLFVDELIRSPTVSRAEFDNLARAHQLMPNDAMERVNEWADETLGDMLIIEGANYSIQRHLLEATK